MKKKSLLLAISAMSIAAIGVGTVGTFAWYQATSAAGVTMGTAGTGSVGVDDTEKAVNGIKIHASPVAGAIADLLITNNAGRSYAKNGSVYTQLNAGQASPYTDRQGSKAWSITVTDDDGTSAPKAESVASLANKVYQVKVTPSGQGKASLTQTTALGSAGALENDPSDDSAASAGALAATKNTAVTGVFYIKFLGTGVVQYSTDNSSYTNWADPTSAQTSNVVYFGIENASPDGEAKSGLAATYDFTLTPDIALVV